MAGDILDTETIDINGKEYDCESISMELENSSKTVNAMTKTRKPLGVAKGNSSWSIKADLAVTKSRVTEIMDDLDELESDSTAVPIIVTQENGRTVSYEAGVVVGLSDSSSHGEEIKRSVTITAWGRTLS